MTPPKGTAAATPVAEAVDWFIALEGHDVTPDKKAQFADWLRRSPVHVQEFLQLTALRGDLGRLPDLKDIDVKALLTQSNSARNIPSITPFSTVDDRGPPPSAPFNPRSDALRKPRRRVNKHWLAAAALASVIVGLAAIHPLSEFLATEHYSTAAGEQRSLTLTDGSLVQLNVRSSLRAQVNAMTREIELTEGEALFQVGKDSAHPFRVHTPQAVIEALGTQFNVYVKGRETIVSLVEGAVAIVPTDRSVKTMQGGSSEIRLVPGQQVTIAADARVLPSPHAADVKTVTAWTEHRLVFEDAPLSEVIAEFNRYSRQPLVIHDPKLLDLRITASFDSGSAQVFADSLAATRDLKVTRQSDGTWLIER